MFEEIERRHRAFEAGPGGPRAGPATCRSCIGAGAALVGVVRRRCSTGSGWPCRSCCWPSPPPLRRSCSGSGSSGPAATRRRPCARPAPAPTSTFQINRVNGLLTSDQPAGQMMRAAEEHRAALAEWRVLVGDIPVDWALEHAGEIRRQAARLRDVDRRAATRWPSRCRRDEESDGRAGPRPAAAAGRRCKSHRRRRRELPAAARRRAGRGRPAMKPELLELLMKASADQQVIYLTEDEDVASWARVEALTGAMSRRRAGADRRRDAVDAAPRHRRRPIAGGLHRRSEPSTVRRRACGAGSVARPWRLRLARLDDAEAIRQIYNRRGLDLDGHLRPRAPHARRPDRPGCRPDRAPTS